MRVWYKMFRYICCNSLAFTFSSVSFTISSNYIAKYLVHDTDNTTFFLGRDVPAQMVGLLLNVFLFTKIKNPRTLGIITSSMFPIGTSLELYSTSLDPEYMKTYVVGGSILRTISMIGPTTCHYNAVMRLSSLNDVGKIGTYSITASSLSAIVGTSSSLFFLSKLEDENYKKAISLASSFMYPLMLTCAWRVVKL